MTPTQQQRYIRICEAQGIKVTRTKKGLFLRFPDGTSTVQHFTQSDVKANQNQISRFRRAGMTHPDDPRGPVNLPAYITNGTISANTRKKIIEYVIGAGFPEIVYQKDVTRTLNMDPGWCNRALYHTGFRPGKAKNAKIGRPWYTPQDILDLKDKVEEAKDLLSSNSEVQDPGKTIGEATTRLVNEKIADLKVEKPDPGVGEENPPVPTSEQVAQAIEDSTATDVPIKHADSSITHGVSGDREFIDSHESWTVEPEELFGSKFQTFLKDELRVLQALGLEFEIRVWRKQ